MVYFNHVVLMLKTHKYPRIFCVTQNILESCDRRSQHYARLWWRHSCFWDILIQICTLFCVAVFGGTQTLCCGCAWITISLVLPDIFLQLHIQNSKLLEKNYTFEFSLVSRLSLDKLFWIWFIILAIIYMNSVYLLSKYYNICSILQKLISTEKSTILY